MLCMHLSRSRFPALRLLALVTGVSVLWAQLVLLDDDDAGLVGSYDGRALSSPRIGLGEHEQQYVDGVYQSVRAYSQAAKRRRRRHYALAGTAIVSAAAVPATVAGSAPAWLIASLGALAAVSQGFQQLLQDQRIGTESHALAVALNTVVRRFRLDFTSADMRRQPQVFRGFVKAVEDLRQSRGGRLIELLNPPEFTARKEKDAQP